MSMGAPSASRPPSSGKRLAWPDLARGGCMVLVVLLHTDCALAHINETSSILHLLNALLVPLRQPLFFLISGMLSAGILSRGPRGVLTDRVGRYLWLYVLWWLLARNIHTGLLDRFGPMGMEDFFMTPENLGELFNSTFDDHWFFYALAVFFALALLLSYLPDWLHAIVAMVLAIPGLMDQGIVWNVPPIDWLWYYPFFALGTRRPDKIWQAAPWLGKWPIFISVGMVWIFLTRLVVHFDPLLGSAATAALALIAVPVGLGAAVRLSIIGGPVARGLIAVGRSTLPIYVLHPLVLRLLFITFDRPEGVSKACWVSLLATIAVVASLYLGRGLSRVPGLFDLPSCRFLWSKQASRAVQAKAVSVRDFSSDTVR